MSRFMSCVLVDTKVIHVKNTRGDGSFSNVHAAMVAGERFVAFYPESLNGTIQVYRVVSQSFTADIWSEAVGKPFQHQARKPRTIETSCTDLFCDDPMCKDK